MTPRSRQVALQGVGFGSRAMALQGFVAPVATTPYPLTSWPVSRRRRRKRRGEEALIALGIV